MKGDELSTVRLWIMVGLLMGLWLVGVLLRANNRFIHLLPVLAIVLLVWLLTNGRRSA